MARFRSGLLAIIIILAAPVLALWQRELQDATVTEILASDPDLSYLSALATTGLMDALNYTSTSFPITLFAPIDAAFAALPDQAYLAKLLTPPYAAHLQSLLRLHTVGGSLPSSSLTDGLQVAAGNGETLIFSVDNNGATTSEVIMIDSPQATTASMLLEADIQAANGVVHKVDGVLVPGFFGLELPDLSSTGSFGIFAQLFEESGIAAFIGSIEDATGLFPTDVAYSEGEEEFYRANPAAFIEAVSEHVIYGVHPVESLVDNQTLTTFAGTTIVVRKEDNGAVFFGDARVTQANILAKNAIGHAVDKILPEIPSLSENKTLAEIITSEPDLSILALAITTAGLLEPLQNSTADPLTVFAPINASFAALDQSYLTQLLTPPYVAHLQSLIRLHTVENILLSTGSISDGMQVTAGNGETLTFRVDGPSNKVTVEGPAKNAASVLTWVDTGRIGAGATNGAVYKVDGLLLPTFFGKKLMDVALAEPSIAVINDLLEHALQFQYFLSEVTVLAPIDEAFGGEEYSFYQDLAAGDFATLWQTLNKFVFFGLHPMQNLENSQTLISIGGTLVTVTKGENGEVFFNDALVTKPNILAQDGIIHAVDKIFFGVDLDPTPGPFVDASETNRGVPLGATIGISVGITVGVALFAGLAFFLMRRNRKDKKKNRENGDEDLPVGEIVTSVIAHPVISSVTVEPVEEDRPARRPPARLNERAEPPTGGHDTVPRPRFKDQVCNDPRETNLRRSPVPCAAGAKSATSSGTHGTSQEEEEEEEEAGTTKDSNQSDDQQWKSDGASYESFWRRKL